MSLRDSTLDSLEVARVRALLAAPARRDPMWPALVAATTLALTAVMFPTIMVLAPPVTTEHMAKSAPGS